VPQQVAQLLPHAGAVRLPDCHDLMPVPLPPCRRSHFPAPFPFLHTRTQVGTLVPVDPKAMFMSVVQLVLAPVIVGTTLNQYFPRVSRDCTGRAEVQRWGLGEWLHLQHSTT
jgi:hypothetical protein